MDKLIYLSMNGAKNAMHQLEVLTNNLANANTVGFRADQVMVKPSKDLVKGQTRIYAKIDQIYTDYKSGPIIPTDRGLDIAIDGKGFMSVLSKTGQEAYTRAGDLQITQDGYLETHSGQMVLGTGGVITIPAAQQVRINEDGTVLAKFSGQPDMVPIDKIKLVDIDTSQLDKHQDGLFYLSSGTAVPDNTIKIKPGALEGSNVNAIDIMAQIIDLSRTYEIHTNFMKTNSENATKENQLLSTQV